MARLTGDLRPICALFAENIDTKSAVKLGIAGDNLECYRAPDFSLHLYYAPNRVNSMQTRGGDRQVDK